MQPSTGLTARRSPAQGGDGGAVTWAEAQAATPAQKQADSARRKAEAHARAKAEAQVSGGLASGRRHAHA